VWYGVVWCGGMGAGWGANVTSVISCACVCVVVFVHVYSGELHGGIDCHNQLYSRPWNTMTLDVTV